jgi:hypothetical protein
MRRIVMATVAAVFFVAGSGWTMLAQAQGTIPTEAQRRECERDGGYWDTASGSCEIGARVKAGVTEAQRRECERNGGYWDTASGSCEIGAKDKAKL